MYFASLTSTVLFCFVVCTYTQQCDQSSDAARFDCFPEDGSAQDKCQARNCCWREPTQQTNSTRLGDLNVPLCFFPSDYPSYEVMSSEQTEFGQRLRLYRSKPTYLPHDIRNLTVDLLFETPQRFRVQIYDSYFRRYQVPLKVPVVTRKTDATDYHVVVNNNPFSLVITRKSTGATLFDSSVAPFIFADQFIKLSTRLASPLVYGFGEHEDPLLMNLTTSWRRLTFWDRDVPPIPDTNLYGDHPFHMNLELNQGGQTNVHGQFLLNSNAMDVDLQPLPALTYTTIGGIIDLYVFTGPTVQNVLEQYWQVIGAPMLPPYWSLGFHLCRYGYNSISNMNATIQRMHAANFPYDVQWTDIDTMSNHLDFTYDKDKFAGLPDLVRSLQANQQRYVPIIDPGISSVQPAGSYPPYDEGLKRGVFIKKANSEDPIIGTVWPGQTAFPDFTHPNATQWWTEMAKAYHDDVPFDGMWIDMNEPSNFVDGAVDGCPGTYLDNPPFTPHVLGGTLASKTLCPSSRQYLSQHYNLHCMYGHFEAIASNAAMATIRGKRPFILSRSTFAGSGQYTAHWTGDNFASFDELHASISTILTFNMFGITHVGADICGFRGNTTEELCTRWMQVGAFYPFMRNHNDLESTDQDPAVFSKDAQQIMKQALNMRYTLAPYWYTLHYEATAKSRPIVQPLFFQYTNDPNTHSIDTQFLVGPAILVSPIIVAGSTTVRAYIPQDAWYEFPSGTPLTTVGQFVDLDTPIQKINVHVRGGFIIPTQTPGANLLLGRSNPFQLLAALSQSGSASGNLYWDDGDSLDSVQSKRYNYFEFSVVSANTLTISALTTNYKNSSMTLDTVTVLGLKQAVNSVKVNGQSYSNFHYNSTVQSLEVYALSLNLLSQFRQRIQWTTAY